MSGYPSTAPALATYPRRLTDARERRRSTERPAASEWFRGARVLKFGGSSVATSDRIRNVARIVLDAASRAPAIVVVSAFQGVTNQLLDCARLAERRGAGYTKTYELIAERHRSAIEALFGRQDGGVAELVDEHLSELHDALRGIRLLCHCPAAAFDVVASVGERLSAVIVSGYLAQFRPSRFVDAREFVTTDQQFTHANVIFPKTNRAARKYFASLSRLAAPCVPVVTGFIGRSEDGRTTTIGRNGSDYTAAIVGAALGAAAIEIWTDVDGVLSADPKTVPSAFVLQQMTYEEALAMSYFGAKVLHAGTIGPAVASGIPIVIKNTFNPSAAGTLICRQAETGGRVATGISSVDDLTLLTLRGRSTHATRGTAERLFPALAAHGVNVILSSQASSERTICFAVKTPEAAAAARAVTQEFAFELDRGLAALDRKENQAIIAVVGDGLQDRPDAAGKVFGALGRRNITVNAIAHGASQRSLSCVIDAAAQGRALNAIHRAFFETRKSLALVVVGVGKIGGALLAQLDKRRADLLARGFDARVVALANSKRFVVDREGIDLGRWRETLDASKRTTDLVGLANEIAGLDLGSAALLDCTADASLIDAYPAFIEANLHIVTPNKLANVLPWPRYTALKQLMAARRRHFFDATNVGAGLPILSTLRDLTASGDAIVRIEGMLSGTLSYLFNVFDGSATFSAVVRNAHAAGYTEPDPREDLAGRDVARKLLILARQLGLQIDLEDVCVDSLVPPRLAEGSFTPQFFSDYAAYDGDMQQRLERARARGTLLRYVGTIEDGRAHAELREYPIAHPFGATQGCDNVISVTSSRYSVTPLIVQGPGAGVDVTAMGIFSEIVKLLQCLPD
jgi:aspartokinase/homoserine dehydrogenase 1